ncbi:transcription antitermination protein NusG [Klebsiella pneumoniae subsp. ozaenae]|uniref:Transcription antitermination protein NusG n=1 Tax=Klebsiella pneumoniae subsp. ozaenae TaxID=574 RepID=A0A377Z049_KLEPO|nr:transcription antitermination protein NusG [Klebsiella pneumoniae subsp. ozaenae]
MSEAPKKRWYVVQAFSGFEGRVATSLREHIKLHNMEELFGEVMVPTEEVLRSVAASVAKANVNSSRAMSWFRWS